MKRKKQSTNRLWNLAILFCIALAIGCLIFTSVIGNLPKPDVDRSVASTPEISGALESAEPIETPKPNPIQQSASFAALQQTAEAGSDYIDGIYFLGDGSLKALNGNNLLAGADKDKQVWTSTGNVFDLTALSNATFHSPVTGNEVPAGDIVYVNRPNTVIFLPSTDNASLITEAALKSSLSELVTSIRAEGPETHIIFSSLTPVAESYQYEDITFEVLNRVNQWIAEAAESNNVKYLDAAFELAGTDGYLPDNYHTGDGMHLNDAGLKAWFDCVKTHAYS